VQRFTFISSRNWFFWVDNKQLLSNFSVKWATFGELLKIFGATFERYPSKLCKSLSQYSHSHTSVELKCTKCLRRNTVYQFTCNSCGQQYIGSTTRFIHDRVREHVNNENSSVKKHLYSCQNEDLYKGIEVEIVMSENDPANLRLYKAFYIRKYKPTLNSREECTEFADILF